MTSCVGSAGADKASETSLGWRCGIVVEVAAAAPRGNFSLPLGLGIVGIEIRPVTIVAIGVVLHWL